MRRGEAAAVKKQVSSGPLERQIMEAHEEATPQQHRKSAKVRACTSVRRSGRAYPAWACAKLREHERVLAKHQPDVRERRHQVYTHACSGSRCVSEQAYFVCVGDCSAKPCRADNEGGWHGRLNRPTQPATSHRSFVLRLTGIVRRLVIITASPGL